MTGLLTDSEKFLTLSALGAGLAVGMWLGILAVPPDALTPEFQETVRGRLDKSMLPVPTYFPILTVIVLVGPALFGWTTWISDPSDERGESE